MAPGFVHNDSFITIYTLVARLTLSHAEGDKALPECLRQLPDSRVYRMRLGDGMVHGPTFPRYVGEKISAPAMNTSLVPPRRQGHPALCR